MTIAEPIRISYNTHMKILSGVFLTLTIASLLSPVKSFAVVVPPFSSCLNPQGTTVASYSTGTHGIVGDTSEHTGSDSVYLQTDGNLVQCFCPTNGMGIQTNWLKASAVSQNDVNVLINSGWTYIPDGSAWGLDPVAYLAQNTSYSCQGTSNGGSGSTGGSSGSSSSSSNGSSTGIVQAATTHMNNLANTGDMQAIVYVFGAAIFSLITFTLLKRLSK